jgi:glycerophosphoryl diester phosphodiesterase
MNTSDDEQQRPFLIVGHRGSPREARENTLQSIRVALDGGADGFEVDLRRLSDGTAVIYHDDDIEGVPVESHAVDDFRAKAGRDVPLVSELGDYCGKGMTVLEVKRRGWEHDLLAVLPKQPQVTISSFDHRCIATLRSMDPTLSLGLVIAGYLTTTARYAAELGVQWYFPHHGLVDRELVDDLHSVGIGVVPYTVNTPARWAHLRELGCDGIITDFPRQAVQWRMSVSSKGLC